MQEIIDYIQNELIPNYIPNIMSIAIIGLGKWGKNLVRELSKLETVSFCVSEGNSKNVKWLKQNYPNIVHTTNFNSILNNKYNILV